MQLSLSAHTAATPAFDDQVATAYTTHLIQLSGHDCRMGRAATQTGQDAR